jgi:Ca-activated chloride channel family protein
MDLSQLHFAQPDWLWTLLFIPLVWGLYFLYYQVQQPLHQLEKFIDKHLIPYLLIGGERKKNRVWTRLLFWSFVWCSLALALAGPRWNFREIATFSRDQNLAILLDLSESMNAKDIAPSRLGRAKQKIEDLLSISKGVKIGLVAFAADPHMIVPMTEDKETIRHLLPSLDTDLVYVQGSKLAPALEMAATMLENEPGENKAIVVISDGGFEDASAIHTAKKLAGKGIVLYTIGVGSLEGAPVTNRQGAVVKKNGAPIISKLEKEKFREVSKMGNGIYFDADHSMQIARIVDDLEKRSDVQLEAHKTQRFWEESFYLFLLPVLPFFLWWYRRGYIFVFLLFLPTYSQASLSSYFYNAEQQAHQAYEKGDYTTAGHEFQDPYRKGVAYYRMGDYPAAEEMFRQSARPEAASSAAYNLGNALVLQNKLQDAIAAYEEVLKKWPDHKQAKENLELVKKMLEQQEQQEQQKQQDQQEQKDDQKPQENSNKQKNKEDQQQQEQKEGGSKNQDAGEQTKEQPQKDSPSPKKESDKAQNQEQAEESSQQTPEEKETPKGEGDLQQPQKQTSNTKHEKEKSTPRSQEDLDADLWLDQIKNDPKSFLKNKFYLESKKNGTKEEIDPW